MSNNGMEDIDAMVMAEITAKHEKLYGLVVELDSKLTWLPSDLLSVSKTKPGSSVPKPLQVAGYDMAAMEANNMQVNPLAEGKSLGDILHAALKAKGTSVVVPSHVVHLKDAKVLFQPVHGTSPGSKYFVVALADDLAVAARYQGSSLSVRVEGPALGKYKVVYPTVALASHDGNYASAHFSVPDYAVARKVLGAVLFGLGVDFKQLANPNELGVIVT